MKRAWCSRLQGLLRCTTADAPQFLLELLGVTDSSTERHILLVHPATGGPAPELDARQLQAEVWQLRQLLADTRTLEGWTAAGRLSGDSDDLSVHRRHPKGACSRASAVTFHCATRSKTQAKSGCSLRCLRPSKPRSIPCSHSSGYMLSCPGSKATILMYLKPSLVGPCMFLTGICNQ